MSVAPRQLLVSAVPGLFVLLWSTGFIGAKFGLPYIEPLTFLFYRMCIVVLLLAPLAILLRARWSARWPGSWREVGHIAVAGLLIHAIYLGGVFVAIDRGMPAGIAALIVGLQPLLTAACAGAVLGERVRALQWLGLLIGFVGVALVIAQRFDGASFEGFDGVAVGFVIASLLGISLGTLYQKRHCPHYDLVAGAIVQYSASAVLLGLAAVATEEMRAEWTGELIFAMTWLVLVLSVGAVSLLALLIRWGAAARVASLFYLVPPVVALEAWLLFDERLSPLALLGMLVTAFGVYLVVRPQRG